MAAPRWLGSVAMPMLVFVLGFALGRMMGAAPLHLRRDSSTLLPWQQSAGGGSGVVGAAGAAESWRRMMRSNGGVVPGELAELCRHVAAGAARRSPGAENDPAQQRNSQAPPLNPGGGSAAAAAAAGNGGHDHAHAHAHAHAHEHEHEGEHAHEGKDGQAVDEHGHVLVEHNGHLDRPEDVVKHGDHVHHREALHLNNVSAAAGGVEVTRLPELPAKAGLQLCVGISTTYRAVSQFLEHMRELRAEIAPGSNRLVVWQSKAAANNTADRAELEKMGFVVHTDHVGYPALDRDDLKRNFGDALERVRWRSKQVMDYSNILQRCYAEQTPYILIIEDDLQPTKGLFDKLWTGIQRLPTKEFGLLALYSGRYGGGPYRELKVPKPVDWWEGPWEIGAVALLYRREIVPELVPFLQSNAQERPVDWLIPGFIGDKKGLRIFEQIPNLFQHMGAVSSFKENKDRSKMKSPSFRPA